jgi:predicted dehydrogenase/nucleoside-diphosphate-sugar epimerase
MNVLITGASGFLGRYIVPRFIDGGHKVRVFVRTTSNTSALEKLGVEIVRGDLKDSDSLAIAVAGMDTVVHAAASMAGTPQEQEAATTQGTHDLLRIAEEAGVKRFIHVSSIVVLEMRMPRGGGSIQEDGPYETCEKLMSHYTRSKMGAEKAAVEFAANGKMAVLILRPGLLFGPGGKLFLPRMGYGFGSNCYALIGMGGNPLPVSYVANCADAIFAAAEKVDVTEGIFNIVDDEPIKQIEYMREVKATVRPNLKIVRVPYLMARTIAFFGETTSAILSKIKTIPWPFRANHMIQCVRRLSYSNAKAKELLGWAPKVGKAEALKATCNYFRDQESFSRRADIRFVGKPPSDAKPLRACLIGCGMIGKVHAQLIDKMPHGELVGVCDTNQAAADELAEQCKNVQAFSDVEAMLETLKPDVVHVLTPPQSHKEYTELAAQHGAHVLVEKPMAMTADEARQMAEVCERHNVKLCVDHNHLYDPVIVRLRKMLELGELGRITWVDSYYGFDLGHNMASRYMLPGGEAHWTFNIPGGLYQNLGPHPICLVHHILGKPTRTTAHARHGRVLPHAKSDEMRAVLETEDASGMATVSLATAPRFQTLTIYGTEKTVFVDLLNKWVVVQGSMKGIPKPISRAIQNVRHGLTILFGTFSGMVKVLTKRWTPYDGVEILMSEFYRAIVLNDTPPVTAKDGIEIMEIMDDIWEQIGPLTPEKLDSRD